MVACMQRLAPRFKRKGFKRKGFKRKGFKRYGLAGGVNNLDGDVAEHGQLGQPGAVEGGRAAGA